MKDLRNNVAVITGAGGGVGYAVEFTGEGVRSLPQEARLRR